jgi:hypothetical protein
LPYRGPRDDQPALLITLQPMKSFRVSRSLRQENYGLAAGKYTAHFEEKESGGDEFTAVTFKTPSVELMITADVRRENTNGTRQSRIQCQKGLYGTSNRNGAKGATAMETGSGKMAEGLATTPKVKQ